MLEQETKWYDKKGLIAVLCVIFWPVGLYGLWKSNVFSQKWKIGGTLIVLILFLVIINSAGGKQKQTASQGGKYTAAVENEAKSESAPAEPQAPDRADDRITNLGEVLTTQYFDVIANDVRVVESVDTGNPFVTLDAENGNKYLIINLTLKNTDSESRMMFDGVVFIDYKGKRWKFDHAEPIMLEGWGMILDQFNPLTTKTTNMVFKIPSEISGPIYYEPGRGSRGKMIFLGNL